MGKWQSDASYFFLWWAKGWYYLISVLDDYTRMILAWDVKEDVTAESISDVVEEAVEWTGMKNVPVEDQGIGNVAPAAMYTTDGGKQT